MYKNIVDLKILEEAELNKIINIFDKCLYLSSENEFQHVLKDIAEFLNFRFLMYCFTPHNYVNGNKINIVNISNPEAWMEMYHKNNFIKCDPVRIEMEKRMEENYYSSLIMWDNYERELSAEENELIRLRKEHGLKYGCSIYEVSEFKDFGFLISFADSETIPDERTQAILTTIIKYVSAAQKRLKMMLKQHSLSDKEKEVCSWIIKGKTNWEIAKIMNISENTIKFHLKNIYSKTGISKRQQLMSNLITAKYLHL